MVKTGKKIILFLVILLLMFSNINYSSFATSFTKRTVEEERERVKQSKSNPDIISEHIIKGHSTSKNDLGEIPEEGVAPGDDVKPTVEKKDDVPSNVIFENWLQNAINSTFQKGQYKYFKYDSEAIYAVNIWFPGLSEKIYKYMTIQNIENPMEEIEEKIRGFNRTAYSNLKYLGMDGWNFVMNVLDDRDYIHIVLNYTNGQVLYDITR